MALYFQNNRGWNSIINGTRGWKYAFTYIKGWPYNFYFNLPINFNYIIDSLCGLFSRGQLCSAAAIILA